MKFNEEKMRRVIRGYLDNYNASYDDDNYKIVESLADTANYEEIIFAYGVTCAELIHQGLWIIPSLDFQIVKRCFLHNKK